MKTAMILIAASLLIAISPSALAATALTPPATTTTDLVAGGGDCRGAMGLAQCAATLAGEVACYALYQNPTCESRSV